MKVEVLDRNNSGWYLCKVLLKDYIESLTEDSFNYDIQRGIVSNPYLDTILNSVLHCDILPPLSIVTLDKLTIENEKYTIVGSFDILDGLQRTYRLWVYYRLTTLAHQKSIFEYRKASDLLKQECDYSTVAVSSRQIRKLFDRSSGVNVWNLKELYSKFYVYLYVWDNLSSSDVVRKMLILNAGQSKMTLQHQFELMYLHIFEKYKAINNSVKLIRSKERKIIHRGNLERKIGEYLVPTVVIGIQSLIAAKPERLSRRMLYKASDEDMYAKDSEFYFRDSFINDFLDGLYQLDYALCFNNSTNNLWFSKDTVISGIMGGIGQYHRMNSNNVNNPEELLHDYLDAIMKIISKKDKLNIEEYNDGYDSICGSQFNIGIVIREAIAYYICNMLNDNDISWSEAFRFITEKENEEIGDY